MADNKKRTKSILSMRVNGEDFEIAVNANDTLLEALRDKLDLTGVKEGCSEGVCGACSVLMDRAPVRSCLTLALDAEGSEIITVEGLAERGELSPLQEAFIEHGAVQCGFCTPGMLISSTALLEKNPNPTTDQIKDGLAGHFCRCTGYKKIVEAVESISPLKGAD